MPRITGTLRRMVDIRSVTVQATLQHPIEQVFDWLVDSRNDEQWCPMVSDVELVEGDEPGEGALYRYQQSQGPGQPTITVTMRTTAASRPTELAWVAESGARHETHVVMRSVDRGTRITQTNRVQMPTTILQVVWFAGAQFVLRTQLRRLAAALDRHHPE